MASALQQLNEEMADLIARVRPGLVEVRDGHRGSAAGTIWHSRGLIVTNAHIVRQRHPQVMLSDGHILEARLLSYDDSRDLAAVAVDVTDLPIIRLGDSTCLEPGQFVIVLGHPWGINSAATAGIIMSVGAEHLRISYAQDLVAVNLPLRPGNSGGPLINVEGQLVGINTIMTGSDMGLAIPVHVAKAFLRDKIGLRDPAYTA